MGPLNQLAQITVISGPVTGSFTGFVEGGIEFMLSQHPGDKIEARAKFDLLDGTIGERLLVLRDDKDVSRRHITYFIPGRKADVFIVTATALAAEGDRHDAVCDAAIRTFTAEAKEKGVSP